MKTCHRCLVCSHRLEAMAYSIADWLIAFWDIELQGGDNNTYGAASDPSRMQVKHIMDCATSISLIKASIGVVLKHRISSRSHLTLLILCFVATYVVNQAYSNPHGKISPKAPGLHRLFRARLTSRSRFLPSTNHFENYRLPKTTTRWSFLFSFHLKINCATTRSRRRLFGGGSVPSCGLQLSLSS
jgi:hypothetical protein